MKIAWFTPFSQKSAIGKYSRTITSELSKHCDVELWIDEINDPLKTANVPVNTYSFTDNMVSRLSPYDIVVYNFGNHFYNHHSIYEVSKRVKGIAIVHDFILHDFFLHYYLEYKRNQTEYLENFRFLYGEKGREDATLSLRNPKFALWKSEKIHQYPFFEKVVSGSLGVIAHSQFHMNKILQRYSGPTKVISLPFYTDKKLLLHSKKDTKLNLQSNKLLIVTLGHVNQNKKIDKIIETLGLHKNLAEQIQYVIIGPKGNADYQSRLDSLIARYDLHSTVRFEDYCNDETFYSYLRRADICINLRFPTYEGASASIMEEMYFGKPTIVMDTGCYGELPKETVIKVRNETLKNDLAVALSKLISDPTTRQDYSNEAEKYAHTHFEVEEYVKKFLPFAELVTSYKPILKLTDRLSTTLAQLTTSNTLPVYDSVAEKISQMMLK
jgi:glycosyltransferase involved in cell wall biosynthesis